MNENVAQQNQLSPLVSLQNKVNVETEKGLQQTCTNCRESKIECDSTIPCSNCISLNKANCYIIKENTVAPNNSIEPIKTPAKRGYKSHVPSACINCKTAHLACDVSRPCQRCVALKKTDTCQDIQHKKRGRPKLREKKIPSSNEHTYEILYGTIQSPAFNMVKNTNRNIVPNNQAPPFKAKLPIISKRPSAISFIHEPIESFQVNDKPSNLTNTVNENLTNNICQQSTSSIPETSVPLTFDYNSTTGCNNDLTIEAVLPTIQLTTNSQLPLLTTQQQQQQQQFFFQYPNTNLNDATPILLNNGNFTPHVNPSNIIQQQVLESQDKNDPCLSVIMSMEVCCAKVSNDATKYWGYYPQELAHRSFYDFISAKDSDRLARLHRLLLDNAMDISNSNNSNNAPLPSTERSTSSLFSDTDHSTLNLIANGSRSFSDSIHIKKRSGEYELYKVVVYIGGGLGADLYDVTSFSKQYIVAQFRKHEYEVAPQIQLTQSAITSLASDKKAISNNLDLPQYDVQPIAIFSPLSPLSPESPSKSSVSSFNGNNQPSRDIKGHSLFPIKNGTEKRLSATTKFSQMSIIPPSSPPKFHIAPITTPNISSSSSQYSKNFSNSLFRRLPSSASSSTALSAPSSTITSSSFVRMRSADTVAVTHPTQQYFLQTSSSTLNAAASAVQNKSRLSISGPTNNDSSSASNRKIEMSIRSLLC